MTEEYQKINIPSKEELKEIMKNPGKIKGAGFKGEMEYVLEQKGQEGLKAVEAETERLGFPINYKQMKDTDWYPVGLRVVSLSAILNTFNWGIEELKEMGKAATKISFIMRFFMKYFISGEKIFRVGSPRIWDRYYLNAGEIETVTFERNRKDSHAIIRIKGLRLHPIYCHFISGFALGITALVEANIKNINIKETKCMFRGDPYHEYLIRWNYY